MKQSLRVTLHWCTPATTLPFSYLTHCHDNRLLLKIISACGTSQVYSCSHLPFSYLTHCQNNCSLTHATTLPLNCLTHCQDNYLLIKSGSSYQTADSIRHHVGVIFVVRRVCLSTTHRATKCELGYHMLPFAGLSKLVSRRAGAKS